MRDLKYKPPYRFKSGGIETGYKLDNPGKDYYSRFFIVQTKFGYVTVIEFDWKTNLAPIRFTEFACIMNGLKWRAELSETKLSNRQLRWLCTHFIKNIVEPSLK